jgi:hypothetical protein
MRMPAAPSRAWWVCLSIVRIMHSPFELVKRLRPYAVLPSPG